jgi:hypothetical protein
MKTAIFFASLSAALVLAGCETPRTPVAAARRVPPPRHDTRVYTVAFGGQAYERDFGAALPPHPNFPTREENGGQFHIYWNDIPDNTGGTR